MSKQKRIPCEYPWNKFYSYEDEIPVGTRISTEEDCKCCTEKSCDVSHCLFVSRCIELPSYNIKVYLSERNGETGGFVTSDLRVSDIKYNKHVKKHNSYIDIVESMILAHAIAGVDISSPAYLEGIETVIDQISNSL